MSFDQYWWPNRQSYSFPFLQFPKPEIYRFSYVDPVKLRLILLNSNDDTLFRTIDKDNRLVFHHVQRQLKNWYHANKNPIFLGNQ